MEVMFHFAFELVKITLLSLVYGTLLFALTQLLRKRPRHDSLDPTANAKSISWLSWFAMAWVGLFVFMFTYWGDHGLGDTAFLPIGHGKVIESINAMEHARLLDVPSSKGHEVETTLFKLRNGVVCGNLDSWFYEDTDAFFVYDPATEVLKEFPDSSSYEAYARQRALPPISELGDFMSNYHGRWGGWRFWLLP